MSTLQRWTSSNSGLLYGNIMAGQLPQQTKFFNIWISTIEVFQQVSLTLERCVPPQDSFCRDLEVHSLSRCSVNFNFWKKTHVAWNLLLNWKVHCDEIIFISWNKGSPPTTQPTPTVWDLARFNFWFLFSSHKHVFCVFAVLQEAWILFQEETQERRLLSFRYSLKSKFYPDLFIFYFSKTHERRYTRCERFFIFPWPFSNQI